MIAVSYVIDALVLLIYAHAGTVPATIGPAYGAVGLTSVACYLALSETGFTERFRDHYFVVPQLIVSPAQVATLLGSSVGAASAPCRGRDRHARRPVRGRACPGPRWQ